MLRRFLLIALALLASHFALAQQTPETDRLVAVGKLWITVKYFHPYLACRDIDWDKALVDALPKIRGATNRAEYAAAVQSMLDALQDPATYVLPEPPKSEPTTLSFENKPDGTLIVSQKPGAPSQDAAHDLANVIASAHKIVFDLRSGDLLSDLLDSPQIGSALTDVPLETPAQRIWIHNGLKGSLPSAFYYSAFQTRPGVHIAPAPHVQRHEVTLILGENGHLPAIAAALRAAGKGTVTTSPHYWTSGVDTLTMPLGKDMDAIVRLSEPVLKGDNASPYPTPQPDRAYEDMRYPSAEYRILAAYKIWGVFHYFFAYRDLMDEDWDDLLPAYLPKFIAAKDAREYNLTIAEMVTHVADSHAAVQSKELSEYFGEAPVGLRLRLIERKPVITEVLDDEAKKAGVQVGDIVTKVDGENIVDRFHRESNYISSSTAQSSGYLVLYQILNGRNGSLASLVVSSADGQTREIQLKRSASYSAALRNQRTGDVIKLLDGNIGYADLDRLTPDQVNGMFDKFRDTKAIIFDMRGYPRGTAWSIAPRLTDQKDVAAAIFNAPLTLIPDHPNGEMLTSNVTYFFVQRLPAPQPWTYKGKTVMLIDERTISQAEHTGLFFEVANKTQFIGTPSAGANGDVTNFVVPGGVTINFSGHDVRHANGGKLQRLGLQPTVTVAPTIDGIRQGRDEVLEKAIEYLSK